MSELKCLGCGSILQTEYVDKKGFIEVIDSKREVLYCKRCYRLMHYNEFPKILASNEEYELIIDDLLKKDGLIVLVVDLFDFTGTFIPKIIDKLRNKRVILVANKLDLLPKSVNVSKIVEWLTYMCNRYFFRVDAIHVVSSKKGYYIEDLMNTINLLRDNLDVYVMGVANVGKSSLINSILKRIDNRKSDLIATSEIPGTTLSSIKIEYFDNHKSIYDTPGLINLGNAQSNLNEQSYKCLIAKKEIKPITYQIEVGNTVLLGAIASIALISGENVSFTCYRAETVTIHRRKNIDTLKFINKHKGEILTPPVKSDNSVLEFKTVQYKLKPKQDIVISGLGFITVNKECVVEVMSLKNMDVFVRNGIFTSKN
jgi:30S ribosome assembly GTPase